jgi:uncharacterized protein (TIGR01777 family)
MKIVLAGSSGFLGTALRRKLAVDGHELVQLVRGPARRPDQQSWDPYAGPLDPELLAGTDAVVNLGGVPIGHVPWTAAHRRHVVESRVVTTTRLAEAIASNGGTTALVNASGINYYGVERGQVELDENSAPGTGFLADVCKTWESATAPATHAGARVALLRTAIVLDRSGGSFKLLVLPFRLGLGGRVGSGAQYFPTISLGDYVAAVSRIVTDQSMRGAYNLTAPEPATNRQFTEELGRQLRRPTVVRVPGLALTTVVGDVGRAMVGSIRATPRRLMDAGFQFAHPTVGDQLAAALG